MIFATVGSMLPFERLIRELDDWAETNPSVPCFAQIGNGTYEPRHMHWQRKVTSAEYRRQVSAAKLVVAHVGIGSIFSALELEKPILLVPRYSDTKEHTTDHQIHTAKRWRDHPNVVVAERQDNLGEKIAVAFRLKAASGKFSPVAPGEFTSKLREALSR
jgi:UDP-N-acetylglucosamine transferase subunit ALG13